MLTHDKTQPIPLSWGFMGEHMKITTCSVLCDIRILKKCLLSSLPSLIFHGMCGISKPLWKIKLQISETQRKPSKAGSTTAPLRGSPHGDCISLVSRFFHREQFSHPKSGGNESRGYRMGLSWSQRWSQTALVGNPTRNSKDGIAAKGPISKLVQYHYLGLTFCFFFFNFLFSKSPFVTSVVNGDLPQMFKILFGWLRGGRGELKAKEYLRKCQGLLQNWLIKPQTNLATSPSLSGE